MLADFSLVFGNEGLRSRLAADVREETVSHAYIIEGARGCGKHTLALSLSAALACENRESGEELPCGRCASCRKILSGKSPDIITVSREAGKAQMGVEVIRNLREGVRLMPNDLDVKIYIIEDAHTMNTQAQNAFLLTLEEPPTFVKFFLLCESASSLLETVRSRAPTLRMTPLDEKLLREKLVSVSPEAAELKRSAEGEFEEIIKLSSGYLGQAIELVTGEMKKARLEARHLALTFLLSVSERRSGKRSTELLGAFSKKRDELLCQLSEIEIALRDLVLLKKCEGAPLCFFVSEDEAAELSYKFKISVLMDMIEAVGRAKGRLMANSNIRLTLFALFIDCGLL